MAVPAYERMMLPFLKFLEDNKEHSLHETIEHISKKFNLSRNEREQLLPSGSKLVDNRVRWARTYLGKAKLIEGTRRGFFRITKRGIEVLQENPSEITDEYLKRFPEFVEFVTPHKGKEKATKPQKLVSGTLIPLPKAPKHNEIRDMIFEIGKIEGKIAEVEYSIDNLRLDVVWKTITTGNPKWAFEVQMGGNFYEALTKLKHAWDKWNSKPFLVTTDIYAVQARALLEGSFHEMKEDARIVNWEKIVKLHQLLKEAHAIKSDIRF
jgi:hypothetical protein